MRIISGRLKGKRIQAPKRLPVRPTTDMAKEGLFNILGHRYDLQEISVLDLYAGTGNISYEFASRGCTDITAVDRDAGCIRFIAETSENLSFPIRTMKSSVPDYLQRMSRSYDIIFADPPYDQRPEDFVALKNLIFERELVRDGGLFILEHSTRVHLGEESYFKEERKYGSSSFSLFAPQ